jgi:signal transduction histidine kinase
MNSPASPTDSTTELVEFVNQCPFGLIQTNQAGEVLLLNAYASQLLLPVAMMAGLGMEEMWPILEKIAPEMLADIQDFEPSYGSVVTNYRVEIPLPAPNPSLFLSFSVIRLKMDSYQLAFKDVGNVVKMEEQVKAAIEEAALQSGKLEMASGILHDIGNAVTAFGSHVAKLNAEPNWEEIKSMAKLQGLFTAKQAGLDQALGAGKGTALLSFLGAVEERLIDRHDNHQKIGQKLLEITSHIQDILNIQRQYVQGKEKGKRAPLRLLDLLDDSMAMIGRSLEKRKIQIEWAVPYSLPVFSGDKTKLIQVFVNLLKNIGEAFDEVGEERVRTLQITAKDIPEKSELEIRFQDNAIGIPAERVRHLFEKGHTSKQAGSGFGLYNCLQIIETHQGSIQVESPGPGLGATFIIYLPHLS